MPVARVAAGIFRVHVRHPDDLADEKRRFLESFPSLLMSETLAAPSVTGECPAFVAMPAPCTPGVFGPEFPKGITAKAGQYGGSAQQQSSMTQS